MMNWVYGILLFLLIAPIGREWLRKPVRRRQKSAPGQLAKLPQGKTHYRWYGTDEGQKNQPVVICVHGLTTPSFVWDNLAQPLSELGVRVLTYDLYGRGYSDRPRGRQDVDFFVKQLNDLLNDQAVEEPVTLIGYSMGGAIVAAFAAQYPDQVARVAMIAPAGLGHDLGSFCNFAAKTGLLGNWLMHLNYPRLLRKETEASAMANPDLVRLQNGELLYRGYIRSVLSSIRGILTEDMQQKHMAISRLHIKALAILARDDTVIPFQGRLLLSRWNSDARQEVIDNAGHDVAYTKPDEVLGILTAWLQPMLNPTE